MRTYTFFALLSLTFCTLIGQTNQKDRVIKMIFKELWLPLPVGTYKTPIEVNGAENVHLVNFTAPEVDKEETAHFILKVTDKGEPQLSRYKRVIVKVLPNLN